MPERVFNQTEIEEWRKELSPRLDLLKAYREYARSDQGRPMTGAQQRMLGRRGKHPVADNVLKLILRTTASRLKIERFVVDDDAVATFLDEWWIRNRGDALQYATHFAMLRDGNHAVSMRWKAGETPRDQGRVTLHREPWWDGNEGIFIAYGDYDEALFAVKEWDEKDGAKITKRRTVYYPDLIQRMRLDGGTWQPHVLPNDPVESNGTIPWLKRDQTPLGIPVVHFRNNLETDDDYGTSDIAGLLGLQDDLNAIQRDVTAASAFTAFQMYLFTGVQDADEIDVQPGMTIELESAAADGKALPAGDTSNLTGAHSYKRETMAVDTSTPIHVIAGGNWPSGVALLRSEMPLVDKVEALQSITGPEWTTLAHRSTEITNTFSPAGLNEDAMIDTLWADAERLDDLTRTQIDQARADLWATVGMMRDRVLIEKLDLLDKKEIDALLGAAIERDAAAAAASALALAQNDGETESDLDDEGEF